jgi:hypothetical protein
MARRYDLAQYCELVANARRLIPQLSLTSDCIVGFPEESDANFEQTLAVARQVQFSGLHVFRYSQRPNTIAATRPQVPMPVRARRAAQLRELANCLADADRQNRVGSIERVIVESPTEGRGECYHRVQRPELGWAPEPWGSPELRVLPDSCESPVLPESHEPCESPEIREPWLPGQICTVRYTGCVNNKLVAEVVQKQRKWFG